MPEPYWHHNVHYQRLVLRAVPDGCAHALDVGCGDGLLARKLTARLPAVTGVGRSPEAIRTAREQSRHLPNVTFRRAGYLGDHLPAHAHSLVSAAHRRRPSHRPPAGLRRAGPPAGGPLAAIRLGRDRSALDWGVRLAGQAVSRVIRAVRGCPPWARWRRGPRLRRWRGRCCPDPGSAACCCVAAH
ncbi:class I SAM-dependent methyltransferase [Nonomuraea aurantiaca]|uniref:class I SAM-dependent methyltransferase n=1 Tax=Nonomuraea aurantiaca TaxID=2878562 RepID=UPI001CD9E17E|nr:class I SAM-dependent methyltransferase [Nonomuraea aurantiaca]MCA2223644.1 class I SAM-dependent methyltransferase [Nonomuraea aurantiaca]